MRQVRMPQRFRSRSSIDVKPITTRAYFAVPTCPNAISSSDHAPSYYAPPMPEPEHA